MMQYDYTFDVWPSENLPWTRSLFAVFRILNHRLMMTFTEAKWGEFREAVEKDGFTLRAVIRVPHHEPEIVL